MDVRTYYPICALQQISARLLAPNVYACVDFDHARYLLERALDAFDLLGAHVGEDRGSVPIERRQSDLIKVDQTKLFYATTNV